MAILFLVDNQWSISSYLTPKAFWPYTSIVMDVVLTGPGEQFRNIHEDLVRRFKEEGIAAHFDNKTVFALADSQDKLWYFGFKDLRFDMGLNVKTDKGLQPILKK